MSQTWHQIFFHSILTILRQAAKIKLSRVKPLVIGITGSVGKTSCTYLLDAVIKSQYQVQTTFHGNSETGVPLEILGIRQQLRGYHWWDWVLIMPWVAWSVLFDRRKYQVLIAELGIDEPKPPRNMSYLLDIVKPNIGVFLNVSAVHTQQFSEVVPESTPDRPEAIIRAIAKEKGLIVTTLPAGGTAVVNIDNPYIKELLPDIRARVLSFGTTKSADFVLTNHRVDLEGTRFELQADGATHSLDFPGFALFKEYGLTFLAVIAAAQAAGLSAAASVRVLNTTHPLPPGRMSLLPGKKDSTIIDSSYNSSLIALLPALDLVKHLKPAGRKIGILGDMRELGPLAESEHQLAAQAMSEVFDELVLVGPLMRQYAKLELLKLGFAEHRLHTFEVSKGVGQFVVEQLLGKHDLVLVKGSQNTIYLEEAVKEIMSHPNQAKHLLCRQEPYWMEIKNTFFNQVTQATS